MQKGCFSVLKQLKFVYSFFVIQNGDFQDKSFLFEVSFPYNVSLLYFKFQLFIVQSFLGVLFDCGFCFATVFVFDELELEPSFFVGFRAKILTSRCLEPPFDFGFVEFLALYLILFL